MGGYNYIFLSHIIETNSPSYGNRDVFENKLNSSFDKGDKSESSDWHFSNNHFGTHVDAPSHFIKSANSITDFDANFWLFKNIAIIELLCNEAKIISTEEIDFTKISDETEILLIKTGYENFRTERKYWEKNPGFAPDFGIKLKSKLPNLRAVGFDFISVTSYQYREYGKEAHISFLQGHLPVLPIEDMSLKNVGLTTIIKELYVIPLRVDKANGSPVTVIAKL
ncbi:MAG TPA: cyclase family protein [Bacteroidales bacterium]|nr:cyclase family protein [Bacteroidales bacterium]